MTQLNTNVDVKALGKVAVLMGGSSAEREVSLMSGTGVLQALRSRGVDAHAFDPSETDLIELKRGGYARCFIALHGRHGEDGTVQGALELLGIPYTGPGVMASSIAIDKIMTKRIWRFEGLSTPDWRLVSSAAETEQALQAREAMNLLYVAVTRARQHLVFSRTLPHRAGEDPTWWGRMEAQAQPWTVAAGAVGGSAQEPVQVPVLPSCVAATEVGAAQMPRIAGADPTPRPADAQSPAAARLGQAIHRVLEWAARPGGAVRAARQRLAEAAAAEFELPASGSAEVLQLASQVLDSPTCAPFFAPEGLRWAGNEVAVGQGADDQRIDRLVADVLALGRREAVIVAIVIPEVPRIVRVVRAVVLSISALVIADMILPDTFVTAL